MKERMRIFEASLVVADVVAAVVVFGPSKGSESGW